MLGQGVGPVFGGLLSQYLGFRSIFWFLTIVSGVSLMSILVFLPETLRTIAGNGSVRLKGLYKPFIYYIIEQKDVKEDAVPTEQKKKVTLKTVFAPLTFLAEKDVFITLFFGAIVYTVWSMVTSSTSDLFETRYGLNTLEVGLTFLGNGMLSLPVSRYYHSSSLSKSLFLNNIRLRMHVWIIHDWLLDGLQSQAYRTRILPKA